MFETLLVEEFVYLVVAVRAVVVWQQWPYEFLDLCRYQQLVQNWKTEEVVEEVTEISCSYGTGAEERCDVVEVYVWIWMSVAGNVVELRKGWAGEMLVEMLLEIHVLWRLIGI